MNGKSKMPRHFGRLLPLGAAMAFATHAYAETAAQEAAPAADTRNEESLPAITVQGEREQENRGYQSGTTNIGKMNQLPKDIPQSVTVVTGQLMEDRNAHTLREALRNVAGLTFNAGEGGRIGDNITIRGYSAVGDLYLDGMRDIAQYNREVFNLEQIDVLRGSASMLFGRGSTGGVINQVSKKPMITKRNEVAVTAGSFDYKRVTADLNTAFGDTMAARLNLMYTDTESFRDEVEQKRWGVAPSFGWGLGTDNEVVLTYYYLDEENIPDYGVPYFNGRPLDVPVDRFYGMSNADFERNETGIGTIYYTHRFDRDTSIRTALRGADYERDLRAVAPRLGRLDEDGRCVNAGASNPLPSVNDDTIMCRGRQTRGGSENTLTSQTDFVTTFSTGAIEHQFLAGLELVQEDARRWNYVNTGANPYTTVGNPDPNPALAPGFLDREKTAQVSYEGFTTGLYFQDVLAFTPEWKLLVGARHDWFSADYDRPEDAGGDLSRDDNVWSYRGGVMYQPTDTSTYYVSYGTSFNPSAELYALDDRSANTPPEKSRNIEAGTKWELLDGNLSLRTAIFRSEKTHERNTDLAVSVEENLLSGKRHTDGIEVEAAGRITPEWELFGALALMDAEIDEAAGQQANTQGKRPLNTPDHTFNVWTTYKVAQGWRIGGGAEGAGRRYGNNTNTNAVPGYVRWDAMAEYQQKTWSAKLNVLNLLDEDYYKGVYSGHSIPGTKRAVQLTFKKKF